MLSYMPIEPRVHEGLYTILPSARWSYLNFGLKQIFEFAYTCEKGVLASCNLGSLGNLRVLKMISPDITKRGCVLEKHLSYVSK